MNGEFLRGNFVLAKGSIGDQPKILKVLIKISPFKYSSHLNIPPYMRSRLGRGSGGDVCHPVGVRGPAPEKTAQQYQDLTENRPKP